MMRPFGFHMPVRSSAGPCWIGIVLFVVGILSVGGGAQSPPGHQTGLVLATQDQLRGVPLASTPYSGTDLPASTDLSDHMPPPQDQGRQRSCVAWAVAYALKSYQERVEDNLPIVQSNGLIAARRVFSPAFVSNQVNNGRDGGARFQDALNCVHAEGAAPWADMPYDAQDCTRRPIASAQTDARRFRIDTWRQDRRAHTMCRQPLTMSGHISGSLALT